MIDLRAQPPARRAVFAVLVGVVVLKDLLHSPVAILALQPDDWFKYPFVDGLPLAAATDVAFGAALVVQALAGFAAMLLVARRAVRWAATALLGIYGYAFLADQMLYTNNIWLLLCCLFLIAVEPVEPTRRAPSWPTWAGRALLTIIYVAAGLAKLDPVWLSGDVVRGALLHYSTTWPAWIGVDIGPTAGVAVAVAAAVAELGLALGLWFRRTRRWAVLAGIGLHLGIELTMPVRTFSYLMVALYVLFVERETAARWLRWAPLQSPVRRVVAGAGLAWASGAAMHYGLGAYAFHVDVLVGQACVVPLVLWLVSRGGAPRSRPLASPRLQRWALGAFVALHLTLALKPLWGGGPRFAWRMFGEVLELRVEVHARRGPIERRLALVGADQHWHTDRHRYHWTSWTEERHLLQGYATWMASRMPSDVQVELRIFRRQNGIEMPPEVIGPAP